MTKTPSPLLRSVLAALLVSPSFSAAQTAAQVVGAASISGASAASSAGAAGAAARTPLTLGSAPLLAPSISADLAPALNSAPVLAPAASAAAPLPAASVPAAPAEAAPAAAPAPEAAALVNPSEKFDSELSDYYARNKESAASPTHGPATALSGVPSEKISQALALGMQRTSKTCMRYAITAAANIMGLSLKLDDVLAASQSVLEKATSKIDVYEAKSRGDALRLEYANDLTNEKANAAADGWEKAGLPFHAAIMTSRKLGLKPWSLNRDEQDRAISGERLLLSVLYQKPGPTVEAYRKMSVKLVARIETALAAGKPVVTGLYLGSGGAHAVTILQKDVDEAGREIFKAYDPLSGRLIVLPKEGLLPYEAFTLRPDAPAAAPVRRSGTSFAVKALVVGGLLLLATPGMAMAAPVVAPLAASAASLSFLASIHPTVTAAGALAGAIYGMFASRSKDGTPASTADVFSSIMRYGVLGGAGTYVLLNATQAAFGAAIGLQPLSSAIAIAALGRTAFQEKFMYATTSSADRVYGAFPAVAAAVGISVAVGLTATALAVPTLAVTLATGSMAATGVATALFAALFKPGRSPLAGPPNMAKGYVLQALMMGLALSMTNPWLFWPFAAMGAAGFGLVMWTAALEIWAHRPGAPAQPLPPSPPVTPPPAPPAPPTAPVLSPAAQALRKTAAEIGFPAFTAPDYKPGTTKHIVLFRYKDSVTPAQKEEVKQRFLALQQLSQRGGQTFIESIETGPQTSGEGVDQSLEQGFIVTFRSEGDRNFYVGQPVVTDPNFYDPAHQAFKDFVGPLLHDPANPSGVAVFDLATGN